MNDLFSNERIANNPIAQEIFRNGWLHTGKYANHFYRGRFNLAFDDQLDQIFNVIDAKIKLPSGLLIPKHNKINIMSWRGRGKTTIAKTILAKRLRYVDTMYAVYIGKSYDWAAVQTESVKRGMLQNKREEDIFGRMAPKAISNEMQETFSKKAWMTNTGAMVLPRGCGQPVRGLLHDWESYSYRPSLINIDDLVDKDDVRSEIFRENTWEWLMTDVCEAVPPPGVSMDWQIIYIDTVKHADAPNVRLQDDPEWTTLVLPLAYEKLKSNAPAFYTDEQVREKYDYYDKRNELDFFYQEFMCIPYASENAEFKPEVFRHYTEDEKWFQDELQSGHIENVILADPKKSRSGPARTAVVGVGLNRENNKIFVRDVEVGHFTNDEFHDVVLRMATRLQPCHVIGLETHSLHEWILHPFLDEMNRRGLWFEVVELNPKHMPAESGDRTHGKEGRIAGLVSYYKKSLIYHNKAVCSGLEGQLLSYPYSKLWDIMDAFAYIVQLLEKGTRYLRPENEGEEDYSEYQAEKEYISLEENDYEDEDYEFGDDFNVSP